MSKLVFDHKNEEFEVWKFTPDLIHAFPFYMERVNRSWRMRCVIEYFVGYSVYYIKIDGEWAGYCVVSSGRNPRYKFSTADDIIYGRYFVAEKFRGNGLGYRMLKEILDNTGLQYKKAYAYLRVKNTPSLKTIEKLGSVRLFRFNIEGFARNKFSQSENGEFVLYEYERRGE